MSLFGVEARRITYHGSGLCGCFDDPTTCMKGIFAPCCLFGEIASETGTPYAAACTVYAALCGCDWMLLGCSPLRIWGARNRHLLESKRLGGDPPGCRGSYFYTHCLFHSCAMMQEVRALHDYRASERIARSGHSGGFS